MTTGSAIRHFTLDLDDLGWTTVVRNGIGILDPDGDWHVVFEDPREDVLAEFAVKLEGSLAMQRLPTFRSPVPGLPMSHWR